MGTRGPSFFIDMSMQGWRKEFGAVVWYAAVDTTLKSKSTADEEKEVGMWKGINGQNKRRR